MREFERIDRINNLIKKIWERYPDQRFMQLISNISWSYSKDNDYIFKKYAYSKVDKGDLVAFHKDVSFVDCFQLEDDDLEEYLQEYLNKSFK